MENKLPRNFGGYVVGLAIVLATYSAISVFAPQYANVFALVTLLGIVMFYFANRTPGFGYDPSHMGK